MGLMATVFLVIPTPTQIVIIPSVTFPENQNLSLEDTPNKILARSRLLVPENWHLGPSK